MNAFFFLFFLLNKARTENATLLFSVKTVFKMIERLSHENILKTIKSITCDDRDFLYFGSFK